jgi:Restriction endonuclease
MTRLIARATQDSERRLCLVPCDSHLIVITPTGLCSKRIESGAASYAKAVEQLRRQHAKNTAFLNQDTLCNWAQHPKPSRFEEFVRDILGEMPEVCRVKQSGHCNEPDGGRDLIADVYESFLRNVSAAPEQSDDSASRPVRVVIQCKTGMRNIGKGAVSDIRDTLDRERASGFLLVAFPGITRPLLDYIEIMRARNLFWIECWTKPDLEAQLRTNPGIALRYRDVVELLEPKEPR